MQYKYFLFTKEDIKEYGSGLNALRNKPNPVTGDLSEANPYITDMMSYFIVKNNVVYKVGKVYIDMDKNTMWYLCFEENNRYDVLETK